MPDPTAEELDALFEASAPPTAIAFDGATYVAERDAERLLAASRRVHALILERPSQWYSPPEIEAVLNAEGMLIQDVTARIRDLRKPKWGRHAVTSRVRAGHSGTWEYRHDPECRCLGGALTSEGTSPAERLHAEVARLRALCVAHGIDPDEGVGSPAAWSSINPDDFLGT